MLKDIVFDQVKGVHGELSNKHVTRNNEIEANFHFDDQVCRMWVDRIIYVCCVIIKCVVINMCVDVMHSNCILAMMVSAAHSRRSLLTSGSSLSDRSLLNSAHSTRPQRNISIYIQIYPGEGAFFQSNICSCIISIYFLCTHVVGTFRYNVAFLASG